MKNIHNMVTHQRENIELRKLTQNCIFNLIPMPLGWGKKEYKGNETSTS